MKQKSVWPLRAAGVGMTLVLLGLVALGIFAASRRGLDSGVIRAGDRTLDNAQLAYYYWSEYFYFSGAYGEYLDGLVDFSVPLEDQAYSEDLSWQDYLLEETLQTVRETLAMTAQAEAEGFTLPAEDQEALETVVENFRQAAEETGYESLPAYLAASYGDGADEESFIAYLTDAHLAAAYADSLYAAIDPSEEEIADYYDSHAGEYLENYGVTREDGPMPHGVCLSFETLAEAQQVYTDWQENGGTHDLLNNLGAAHLGETGELTAVIPGSVGEAAEAWFYDEARLPGDAAVVSEEDGTASICYYVAAGETTYWQTLAEEDLRHETYQNRYLEIVNGLDFAVNYDKIRLTPPDGLYEAAP